MPINNCLENTPPNNILIPFGISTVSNTFESTSGVALTFLIPAARSVNITPGCRGAKTTGYLARQVARSPNNLRNHVQRINLHIKLNEGEEVYSALLDLFVIVGKNAKNLKKRMLDQSKPLLDIQKYDELARKMEQGIDAATVMPSASYSVLSMGLTGTLYLTEYLQNH